MYGALLVQQRQLGSGKALNLEIAMRRQGRVAQRSGTFFALNVGFKKHVDIFSLYLLWSPVKRTLEAEERGNFIYADLRANTDTT